MKRKVLFDCVIDFPDAEVSASHWWSAAVGAAVGFVSILATLGLLLYMWRKRWKIVMRMIERALGLCPESGECRDGNDESVTEDTITFQEEV